MRPHYIIKYPVNNSSTLIIIIIQFIFNLIQILFSIQFEFFLVPFPNPILARLFSENPEVLYSLCLVVGCVVQKL